MPETHTTIGYTSPCVWIGWDLAGGKMDIKYHVLIDKQGNCVRHGSVCLGTRLCLPRSYHPLTFKDCPPSEHDHISSTLSAGHLFELVLFQASLAYGETLFILRRRAARGSCPGVRLQERCCFVILQWSCALQIFFFFFNVLSSVSPPNRRYVSGQVLKPRGPL